MLVVEYLGDNGDAAQGSRFVALNHLQVFSGWYVILYQQC